MLDKKYNFIEKDEKWQKYWQEKGTYKFDANSSKQTFSIDTPPPTLSGELHIGHIFGYTQADMYARYQRMLGKNLYFPQGFDNNGLATELLVEKKKNIRAHTLPREEFTKIALDLVQDYNKTYAEVFKSVGMSTDFSLGYNTIDERSQKVSQKSFLELAKKGIAYRTQKPSHWCCKCRTSVADAELEDAEIPSLFNYLNFKLADGTGVLPIATTRPEFLPACVAIFVNPEDERYQSFVGKMVKVPLFEDREVKVLADSKVGIEKGTGVVMCCTFGDQTDVEWWKEYNLELKQAIDDGGKMTEIASKYFGLKSLDARKAILEDLKEQGYLFKQEEIIHNVKVHERCGEPIEFLSKKQWFIKVATPELIEKWLELGNQIEWHPATMKARYDAWVQNLNQDWSISRQRYFGIPFPVWYCAKCGKEHYADEKDLPVNPLSKKYEGKCECGSTEFIPESDVLDTWATSSVTPQINCDWYENEEECAKRMPMDMRFCGRDIITTWSLRTIIKAYYHQGTLPWKHLMINGWVMADKKNKISKSKANEKASLKDLKANYGADVIRYYCAMGAYGRDVMLNEEVFKEGYRLINKIWNASKFVLSFLEDYEPIKPEKILPIDEYIMHKFNDAFDKTIAHYENVEVGYAKEEMEKFFWDFCDNYIEIAKNRLYKPEVYGEDAKKSAQWACYQVLLRVLQVFAITFPHITEEIYQEYFIKFEKEESIHTTILSKVELDENPEIIHKGDEIVDIVTKVRTFKSENQISLKTKIEELDIKANYADFVIACEDDIKAVTGALTLKIQQSQELIVEFGKIVLDEE